MAFATSAAVSKPTTAKPTALRSSSPERNPLCRKYRRCLDQAARLDLRQFDCSRCVFRYDRSGDEETRQYLTGYLELLKVIVQGNKWLEPSRLIVSDLEPVCEIYRENLDVFR